MSRADASRPSRPAAPAARTSVLRRLRPYWWAIATLLLVALSALAPANPIRDAASLATLPEATLELPAAYVLFDPFSRLLDTLTLLSLRQHVAFMLTMLVVFALWWWRRGRIVPPSVKPSRRAVLYSARIGLALSGLVGAYVVALLLPRPMATLQTEPDIVAVDFHAHTKYSHDGRWNWEPEDVRRWHRDAGYGAAYISDHRTFEGARDAWANNPAIAGTNTVLLPALEVVWKGEHVNVLDAERVYKGLFTATLRDMDEEALVLASGVPAREPVVVGTLPGDLAGMIPAKGPATAGIRAIEVIDGAPRGLGQTRRERARIVAYAKQANIALVSGSDSHGWGYVAQGWTELIIPNWRAATPEQLADAIGANLRRSGFGATRVVERWVADTESPALLPFTVPLVLWDMLRTLTDDERLSWVAWTLLAAGLYWLRERRRMAAAARA